MVRSKVSHCGLIALLALGLMTTLAYGQADPPRLIPFSAAMTDQTGKPVTSGTHHFTFRLYRTPVGATAVWTERHPNIQVTDGLVGLSEADFDRVAVAYEPVWAIGTGVTATPEQAEEAHLLVRGLLKGQFGGNVSDKVRIQYGGSVKPDNAAELMAKPNVDGSLVGGASLKADGFAGIVKASA